MDAGQLREHLVSRYPRVLLSGAHTPASWRVMAHVERLSRLTGIPFRHVLADLRADCRRVDNEPIHPAPTGAL